MLFSQYSCIISLKICICEWKNHIVIELKRTLINSMRYILSIQSIAFIELTSGTVPTFVYLWPSLYDENNYL